MVLIITRKDRTSIACMNTSLLKTIQKQRFFEAIVAIILIIVGTSIILYM